MALHENQNLNKKYLSTSAEKIFAQAVYQRKILTIASKEERERQDGVSQPNWLLLMFSWLPAMPALQQARSMALPAVRVNHGNVNQNNGQY